MFDAVVMCFSPCMGIRCEGCVCQGLFNKEWVHKLLPRFLTLGSAKMKVLETHFCDTVMTQNVHPSYLMNVPGYIDVVSPPFLCARCVAE